MSTAHTSPRLASEVHQPFLRERFSSDGASVEWSNLRRELAYQFACDENRRKQAPMLQRARIWHGLQGERPFALKYHQSAATVKLCGPATPQKKGGGMRGVVKAFTKASRRRLVQLLGSVNRSAVTSSRMWFLTLTYPGVYSTNPEQWKRDLQTFSKRLFRHFGKMATIWKLEFQKRGAPHFHLMLIVPETMAAGLTVVGHRTYTRGGDKVKRPIWHGLALTGFRQWLSQAWYDVVGSNDPRHLDAGTECSPMESWNQASGYAAKYLGKPNEMALEALGCEKFGRFWGVWNKPLLPIEKRYAVVGWRSFVKVRRVLRRYVQSKRGPRGKRLNAKHLQQGHNTTCLGPALSTSPVAGHCVPAMERLIAWACPGWSPAVDSVNLNQGFRSTLRAMVDAGCDVDEARVELESMLDTEGD